MMPRILLIITAACFLTLNVSAQYDFSKVDKWLDENVVQMGGRAILVIYKDGKIIYNRSANNMNLREKWMVKKFAERQNKSPDLQNYTDTTKLSIASCSKWLSAALVMTFVDEGKLSLSDTVGKFLPVLSKNGKGNITISECLSHLTSIKEPPLKESIKIINEANSMYEAIANIAILPMEGKPGTVFHYSNAGLQIAGAVIEKISGKSFQTLFAERIAIPLNMKHTDFGKGKVALPAGGAHSTSEDYMHFLEMILNKGVYNGKRILNEKTVAEMQVNRINKNIKIGYSPAEAGDFGYGYGEWIMEISAKNNLTTTVTSPGLFGSFPWVDNEKKYCAFLMSFNLKNQGRNEKYKSLKKFVDDSIR